MTIDSLPRCAGIYVITCKPTGKIYVGSSRNIHYRCNHNHIIQLKHNRHPNKHMQRAWNVYGKSEFDFAVLEIVDPDLLLEREQYWIDTLQPFGDKGFNGNRNAGKSPTLGVGHTAETKAKLSAINMGKRKGEKFSEEHRQKISNALKGHKISDETRAKIGASNKGKTTGSTQSPEQIQATIERSQKNWVVIDPNGVEHHIKGLAWFCREHNLNQPEMWNVANGKRKTHKGWRCRRVE